jgi:hypothetical protein
MSLPFTDQQCFFLAMLVFAVVGFQRGWRREVISLVFVLLGVLLVGSQDSGRAFGEFLSRLPGVLAYLVGSNPPPNQVTPQAATGFLGPWGPILVFVLIYALGFYIGRRAFPGPSTPQERFVGIVPAVISGAFILTFLTSRLPRGQGNQVTLAVQAPDPANYVATIFVIIIVALVVGLIVARAKKPVKK